MNYRRRTTTVHTSQFASLSIHYRRTSEPVADFTCMQHRETKLIYIQFDAMAGGWFCSRRSVVTNTAVTVESRPSHASTLTFNKANQPLQRTKPVIIGNHGPWNLCIHANISFIFFINNNS